MTNNEKLKIIQKHFNLKAKEVAMICFKKSDNTIWAWRSKTDSKRYRNMNDGEFTLLVDWLIQNRRINNKTELEDVLQNHTNIRAS
ncbi:hypothetical protein EAY39_10730 [Vibrio anguillarum]|nr:hypothetical protein CMV05_22340 [Vibrio anguillarum]MBF4249418.1 hypothetical protein [Vibrio anguillarum]MBF4341257.1 hypothetical protein [Vibrio anguillarum]